MSKRPKPSEERSEQPTSSIYTLLRVGRNEVTLDSQLSAVATLRRHGREWRVLVTVDGEECGGHDDTYDGCEVWFAGWLNGWISARRLIEHWSPRATEARRRRQSRKSGARSL